MSLSTSSRTAAMLVAACLTCMLALTGAAHATVLTKGAVRKIATKVLTKRAGRLSVAHAETATTATTLDSFTAAQLLTTGYRFALPSEPTASTRDYTFPGVPAGT